MGTKWKTCVRFYWRHERFSCEVEVNSHAIVKPRLDMSGMQTLIGRHCMIRIEWLRSLEKHITLDMRGGGSLIDEPSSKRHQPHCLNQIEWMLPTRPVPVCAFDTNLVVDDDLHVHLAAFSQSGHGGHVHPQIVCVEDFELGNTFKLVHVLFRDLGNLQQPQLILVFD